MVQAGAAAAVAADWVHLGSMLYCLSLNHKHMAAYFAPAFFAHLLGRCLQQPTFLGKVGRPPSPPSPPSWLISLVHT